MNRSGETTDKEADAEIWRCIGTIEFNFGQNVYTTKEAGLVFTYETGMECGRMYVIALSEKCGAVIFYIPDDLFELISERAGKMMCSPGKYITDLIDYNYAAARVLDASARIGIPPDEAAAAMGTLAAAANGVTHSAAAAAEAFRNFNKALDEYNARPERKSNNWLKLHGFPMRRKGKGRKKRE